MKGKGAMAEPIWALGLMSGTSMDGVDAAMALTDGETVAAFGASASLAYRPGDAERLERIVRDWRAFRPPASREREAELDEAGADVLRLHACAVAACLAGPSREPNAPTPALIGFHGQTIAHAPALGRPGEGWTWQLGDGAALARLLNRPVAWDFRAADVAAGGEGAPLAPFFQHALARKIGAAAPLVFLNIGGVANVAWIDPTKTAPEEPGALLAFDTGPGNALLNDWMQRRTGAPLDRDGAAAAAGEVDWTTVHGGNAVSAYLERRPPKSLDRNEFSATLKAVEHLSVEDGAATLTALTVECVAAGSRHLPSPPARWLVCGGGRRNAVMMRMLADRLDAPVEPVEAAGLDGDMLEAQAFAYLAVRALRGLPLSAPGTTGCLAPIAGGRVSCPEPPGDSARDTASPSA